MCSIHLPPAWLVCLFVLIFVSKALLEHSQAHSLYFGATKYGWVVVTEAVIVHEAFSSWYLTFTKSIHILH